MHKSLVTNDLKEFKKLLESDLWDDKIPEEVLLFAVVYGYTEIVDLLLKDGRVDPSYASNLPIDKAASKGFSDILKLLISDKRTNPADDSNAAMLSAYNQAQKSTVIILWKDKRVKNSLNKDHPKIYNALKMYDLDSNIQKF